MMIVHKKQEKGFTLIEILIAIALLGILSAVVIPNVTGYLSKGEEQAYKADLLATQAAVDNYYGNPSNRGLLGANKGKKLYPLLCGTDTAANEANCVSGGTPTSTAGAWDSGASKFFIDFEKLVTTGKYLKSVPASASSEHTGSSGTGSYTYYVKTDGKVESKWTGDRVAVGPQSGIYP